MTITSSPFPRSVAPEQRHVSARPRPPSATPYTDQFSGFLQGLSPAINELTKIRELQKGREKLKRQHAVQSVRNTEARIAAGLPESVVRPPMDVVIPEPFTTSQAERRRQGSVLATMIDPTTGGTSVFSAQNRLIRETREGITKGTLKEIPGIGKLDEIDRNDPEAREKLAAYFYGPVELYEQLPVEIRPDLEKNATEAFLEVDAFLGERDLARDSQLRMGANRIAGASVISSYLDGQDVNSQTRVWFSTTAFMTADERDDASKQFVEDTVSQFSAAARISLVPIVPALEKLRYLPLPNGQTFEEVRGGAEAFNAMVDTITDIPSDVLSDAKQVHVDGFQEYLQVEGIDTNNPAAIMRAADRYKEMRLSELSPMEADEVYQTMIGDTDQDIIGDLTYAIETEAISPEAGFQEVERRMRLGHISGTQAAALLRRIGTRVQKKEEIDAVLKTFGGEQSRYALNIYRGALDTQINLPDGEAPDLGKIQAIDRGLRVLPRLPGSEVEPLVEVIRPELERVKQAGLDAALKDLGSIDDRTGRLGAKMDAFDEYTSQIEGFGDLPTSVQRQWWNKWQTDPKGGRAWDDRIRQSTRTVEAWRSINIKQEDTP